MFDGNLHGLGRGPKSEMRAHRTVRTHSGLVDLVDGEDGSGGSGCGEREVICMCTGCLRPGCRVFTESFGM